MLRRMPAPGESDSQLNLRELVSHPHVVEVLDALSHGPMTLAEISSIVSARRRVLARRCGLLPPRGLVTRNHTGSWDTDAPVAGTPSSGAWWRGDFGCAAW